MATLMRTTPAYFLSMAGILLRLQGTREAFGLVYEDDRCEIRGSEDATVMSVRMKAVGTEIPDMVVASRFPGEEIFEGRHVFLASHLDRLTGLCFQGEHVFSFLVESADGAKATLHVRAFDLRDAKGAVPKGEGGAKLLDILGVRTPEAFSEGRPDAEAVVTERLVRERAHAARVEEARLCPDEVYRFTARDTAADARGSVVSTRAIRAVSLADAEAAFRLLRTEPSLRILRVEVQTMLDFVEGKGDQGQAPVPSPAVMARDGPDGVR